MKLTLNVGCGDRTYDFYPTNEYKCINFDARENLKVVDEVGDVKDLSRFSGEYFDFILASDIIEHFKIFEVDSILQEWRRVLKTYGIIEFRLPNFEAIVSDYLKRKDENRNDMSGVPICSYFSWLCGGAQDYDLNVHYTQYDRRFFRYICEKNGFEEVDWKKDGYNMVVKMRKI
jgi:predicted SAM-dependent methyltransferase